MVSGGSEASASYPIRGRRVRLGGFSCEVSGSFQLGSG